MISAEKEWGDGIRGMALTAARYSLLRLENQNVRIFEYRDLLKIFSGRFFSAMLYHEAFCMPYPTAGPLFSFPKAEERYVLPLQRKIQEPFPATEQAAGHVLAHLVIFRHPGG